MVDGMFGLLILASEVFLRIWSYLRSFLSHTGAATYQEDWGDTCKVQEVVLETDELGKPRVVHFTQHEAKRRGPRKPWDAEEVRKGCWGWEVFYKARAPLQLQFLS